METLRMPEGEPIEHAWINKAVENAQTKIEGRNFDIRKNLLEYGDVMNLQRKALYGLRDEILTGTGVDEKVVEAIEDVVEKYTDDHFPQGLHFEDYDVDAWKAAVENHFAFELDLTSLNEAGGFAAYRDLAFEQAKDFYANREAQICEALAHAAEAQGSPITPEVAMERWRFFEREAYLRGIDKLWKHHLKVMESLREGVNLEAYGQKDPKLVYKKQGYELFEMMVEKIKENVTETLFRAQGPSQAEIEAMRQKRLEEEQKLMLGRGQMEGAKQAETPKRVVHQGGTFKRTMVKVGRNAPCPCGSGKKFKNCHAGKEDELAALLAQKQTSA